MHKERKEQKDGKKKMGKRKKSTTSTAHTAHDQREFFLGQVIFEARTARKLARAGCGAGRLFPPTPRCDEEPLAGENRPVGTARDAADGSGLFTCCPRKRRRGRRGEEEAHDDDHNDKTTGCSRGGE